MRNLSGQQTRLFQNADGWASYIRAKVSASKGAYFDTNLSNLYPSFTQQPTGNNSAIQSNNLSNAAWVLSSSGGPAAPTLVSSTIMGPDRAPVACSFTFPAVAAGNSVIYQDFSAGLASGTWCFSIWMSTPTLGANVAQQIWIFIRDTTGTTIASKSCTVDSRWRRFQCSGAGVVSGHDLHITIGYNQALTDVVTGAAMTGSGGTFCAALAQMEQASQAGPYVPTTTVAVAGGISTFPLVGTGGINQVNGAQIRKEVDQQTDEITLDLVRQHGAHSISPLVSGSRANTLATMITAGTPVLLEAATLPNGIAPVDTPQPVGSNWAPASQGMFTNGTYWINVASGVAAPVVTDNAVTAPDGSATGSTIVFPAVASGSNSSYIVQRYNPLNFGGSVTFSIWAAAPSSGQAFISVYDNTSSTLIAHQLMTPGTGWQRYQVSGTVTSGHFIVIYIGYGGIASETGTGGTLWIWGGQFEEGATTAGPYVATTTSAQLLSTSLYPWLSDWVPVAQGVLDAPDFSQPIMTVTGRDQIAYLEDTWIERVYAYGIWGNIGSRSYPVNYVVVTSATYLGSPTTWQFWQVTTAGVAGSTEPAWPNNPSIGTTQSDGTVTWTYRGDASHAAANQQGNSVEVLSQMFVNDWWQGPGTAPTIVNQGQATGWYVKPYKLPQTSILEAIMTLINQIGFDFRMIWNPTTASFQPTIIYVQRTAPTSVWTFGIGTYFDITNAEIDLTGIRNVVDVIYSDYGNIDPTTNQPMLVSSLYGSIGPPSIAALGVATNSASITTFGRRYMALSYQSCPQLDQTAVSTLANNACSDLCNPLVSMTASMFNMWCWELHDYVTFAQNARIFDSAQSVAMTEITHSWGSLSEGQAPASSLAETPGAPPNGVTTGSNQVGGRTEIGLRGLPASGYEKWHEMAAVPGQAPGNHVEAMPLNIPAATATQAADGGTHLQINTGAFKRHLQADIFELHLSTSNGFTPSTSTLYAQGKETSWDPKGLVPGTVYYHVTIARDRHQNKILSAQGSFTAGYLTLAGLTPALTQNFQAQGTGTQSIPGGAETALTIVWNKNWDQDTIFTASTGVWVLTYAGKFAYRAVASIIGATDGDSANIALQRSRNSGSTWIDVDIGPPAGVVTNGPGTASGGDMICPILEGGIIGQVSDWFRLAIWYSALSGSGGTLQGAIVGTGGVYPPGYPGTRVWWQQELSG